MLNMNDITFNIGMIFPTPIYETDLSNDLIKGIDLSKVEWRGNNYNMTSVDTNILDQPSNVFLKEHLLKHINNYARNIIGDDIDDIYITQSWLNKTEKGERHHIHTHGNSYLSGVFYLSENNSSIAFLRPDTPIAEGIRIVPKKKYDEKNMYSWDELYYQSNYGKLFIFPSTIRHYVRIQESDQTRYSLAFNTMFTGKVGNKDNLTELYVR